MILYRKCGLVGEFETAIAPVEEADMRCLSVSGQGICVHGKAVVHARDLNRAVAEALHGMVRAAMALMHFLGLRANGKAEHLMPEANAEQRLFGLKPLLDNWHGIYGRRGGVAGAVGQE